MRNPVKYTIEAYGLKDMKRLSWKRKFKNEEACDKWCEANDAVVHGLLFLESWEQA